MRAANGAGFILGSIIVVASPGLRAQQGGHVIAQGELVGTFQAPQ
jgi:hypothetical protein